MEHNVDRMLPPAMFVCALLLEGGVPDRIGLTIADGLGGYTLAMPSCRDFEEEEFTIGTITVSLRERAGNDCGGDDGALTYAAGW